ncbi:hypothetical protein [[Clostridium] fimetarium]|uniref:Uncharacterized protein n=1 Tax=[Clostridium] fimetarium TaxID=99656 RepID=A0A1I0NGZ3_9FIRM|nr:hypothetical protein [[Clostridium] fimetarium]SEW00033.1 hypothetical protein SAMN05421659_10361 [[Clostridium] fimetarium]
MSKIDDYKIGAKAVAEPTAKKLNKIVLDMERTEREEQRITNEFFDEVIDEFENIENNNNNVKKMIKFSDINEDRDVTIILEVLRKYYTPKDVIKSDNLVEFIKGINAVARETLATNSNYTIEDIKKTADVNVSLLVYSLVCVCNQLAISYSQEEFTLIRDAMFISNSEMDRIEQRFKECVENCNIQTLVDMFVKNMPDEEEEYITVIKADEEYETEQSVEEGGNFSVLRKIVEDTMTEIDEKYIFGEENQKRTINFINKHGLEVAENTLIAFIEYSKIGVLNTKCVLFTTHAIYMSEKENVCKISYSQLIQNGRKIISENAAVTEEDKTTFSIKLSDDFIIKFDNVKFNNDKLLKLFIAIIKDFDETMVADKDTVTRIVDMKETIKVNYLKAVFNIIKFENLGVEEIFRLASDMNCNNSTYAILATYSEKGDEVLESLVEAIKEEVPYPSFKSVGYALFRDCYRLLYISKGCDSATFRVKMEEAQYLKQINILFELPNGENTSSVKTALIIPNMAFNQITEKEFNKTAQALIIATATIGVPLGVVVGADALFLNTMWFWFIPGIGTIIATGALATGVVTTVIGMRNKGKKNFLEQRKAIVEDCIHSYTMAQRISYSSDISVINASSGYYDEIKRKLIIQHNLILIAEFEFGDNKLEKAKEITAETLNKAKKMGEDSLEIAKNITSKMVKKIGSFHKNEKR